MADLQRRRVAFLEGRRTAELTDLVERHNGVPLAAPCLREVHSPDSPVLQDSIRRLLEADLHAAVFLTGVGAATVFDAARAMQRESHLRERLERATVVVRGPKPAAVLRKLGVRIDLTAPAPNTSAEVLSVLEPLGLNRKWVGVQLYGEPNPTLTRELVARGAHVIEVAPYAWERPVDPLPILRLLDALDRGEVDALLITSQAQIENLFAVARDAGRTPALAGVVIGAQGPIAQAALRTRGLAADFVPEHGHMGALVLAAANHFATQGVLAQ